MKKILLILLTLVLMVNLGSVCFAAQGDKVVNIEDEENVGAAAYDEQPSIIEVIDEDVAGGSAQTIVDEDVLPKTGGIPAEAFYVVGALLIVSAMIISKIKAKLASKGWLIISYWIVLNYRLKGFLYYLLGNLLIYFILTITEADYE